jgi:hypothetical protein
MKRTTQTIKSGKKPAKKSTKKVEPKKTVTTPTKKNVPAKKAVTTNSPVMTKTQYMEIVESLNSPVTVTKSHYQAIDRNIYFDGYSYRTRVTINGKINSRNFSTVRAAKKYRTEIRKTR